MGRNEAIRLRRSVAYAGAGALVGLGAPAGWLVLRLLGSSARVGMLAELRQHWGLYLYLTAGTAVGFAVFGAVLGHLADRLVELSRKFRELALTDELTSLRNARYFHERLAAECARADREQAPLALIEMDLDHFKVLNDRRGHPFGNRALAQAARIIATNARLADVACRIGGEEFALICPGARLAEAWSIAERIRATLEASPVSVDGQLERLTASFGVSGHWPGEDSDALFRDADQALYLAKASGRNRIVAAPPVRDAPAAQLAV